MNGLNLQDGTQMPGGRSSYIPPHLRNRGPPPPQNGPAPTGPPQNGSPMNGAPPAGPVPVTGPAGPVPGAPAPNGLGNSTWAK